MKFEAQRSDDWHAIDLASVREFLDATPSGLSDLEAASRLAKYGPNELPHTPPPAWWKIMLRQFRSPLIYVLGVAAVISFAIQQPTDAAFIGAVLCLNAVIGGYQEWRAEASTRALQQLLRTRAAVMRDDEVSEIDAEGVVPGDVVWLESGNRVPADMRLLAANGLQLDESLLTGESLAVAKDPAWISPATTAVGDRKNMVYAGSIVARGRAEGQVVATGAATHVGHLALDVLGSTGGRPPLIERLERFTHVVAVAVSVAAIGIAILGVVVHSHSLHEMFMFAVALAVSAIPEGLPVALTVALAIGTTRMARRGVIVRRLAAVEGLGSCTLIASDKTGTLTCNELTVREIQLADGRCFEVTGEGFVPEGYVLFDGSMVEVNRDPDLNGLARAATLCNEGDLHRRNGQWVWRGDAVDLALLSMAHKLGWNREATLALHPQINEIPFEPEHRFAASYHKAAGATDVFVKGAPERVMAMCDWGHDPKALERLEQSALSMAEQGYRVLAVAEGVALGDLDASQSPSEPSGLKLLGFVGMIDPLRPGACDAVAACHKAGVDVWMVTGDHPVTALAIARDLGLATRPDQVVTGSELADMTTDKLAEAIGQSRVFARVAPHQKLQLVNAAARAGHFVAVTGDGVNDAPALRAANIGVAMGRSGTDVAREASELVVSDDNFATIVAGIEEGRIAYDNVRKVIYLLISTGAAEVVLVGLTLAFGLPLPLLPVQLLWLNLVTNGIQDVALAFEPSEGDVLSRPPRPPRERIFNRLMVERTIVSAVVMGLVAFAAFWWMMGAGWSEPAARNAVLLLMVLFENVHIGNCRSETRSALTLSPLRSPILVAGALIALFIHLGSMHVPLGQRVLGVEPMGLAALVSLWALALTVFVAMEIHKWTWARRHAETNA
jgi:magnesium-transporting ATPase (P-type)